MVSALLCLSSAIASAQAPFDFVPMPASVQYADASVSAPFVLDKNVRIEGGEAFNVQYLKDHLARLFDPMGDSWATGGRTISFVRVKSFPQEGYSLEVTPDRILVSGDRSDDDYDEVGVMKSYLEARGVPSKKILTDEKGYSTYESIYRAASEYQIHNPLIVTQQYHLYRALYIADTWSMTATGVAAQDTSFSFGKIFRLIREWFACLKDMNYCWQKVTP